MRASFWIRRLSRFANKCGWSVLALLALFGAARADETLGYVWQGAPRTAFLHAAATLSGRKAPLVIALHGLDQTGDDMQTSSGLDAAADREGFAVVYPDALEKRWSYGRPIIGPMPTINGDTVDNTGFIRTIIDDLVGRSVADATRVYVTGMSRGALMTFTLACLLSDKIAAIAPVASPMTDHQIEDCRINRPMPVLMINGTVDHVQPYEGATEPLGRIVSVAETLDFWRRRDGCAVLSEKRLPHLNETDPTAAFELDSQGCALGAAVRFFRIEGGAHRWPRFAMPGDGDTDKQRNHDIETADEVWRFVSAFRSP